MRPRRLSSRQVAALAAEFRDLHAKGATGALDIEAILEHDLKLQIVPRANLSRTTGKKAWLSADGRSIYVDEGLMCGSVPEYRFTITHEGAHAVLHGYLLPNRPLLTQEQFFAYHRRLDERDEYFLEWQARQWAGQVLVPPGELAGAFGSAVSKGLRLFGRRPVAELYVASEVARHFGVTGSCAGVRIRQDRLWRGAGVAA